MSTMGNIRKESGMVSIMVTMILMIVLSLIVLGFAQISRRNARQSLDRQLSTQAFYAAETGINDVRNLIKTKGLPPAKTDCTNGSGASLAYYGGGTGLNPTVDAAHNVSYTCVMVDPNPTALAINDINTTGTIMPLGVSSGVIQTLTFTWYTKTGSLTPMTGCPAGASGTLAKAANWPCGYGVFRFDLVPTAGPALTSASLQSTTMTSFAVPVAAGGTASVGYATNGSGSVIPASCNNTRCTLTITGLGGTSYYSRLISQYKDISMQITGTDGLGNPVKFSGGQVVIDATGKAQDVLRRIQVHVPINPTANQLSDYAIESTDSVCKRFVVMSNYFASNAAAAVPTMTGSGNPLCN
ncbi:MAG TPA: pilus assembly PilX N-terminal domain-containing protein [Candidatus Saccharimonadales bacterium]|nr:pilus assembly PilX N-terminal domain-containing protein [Candidatus Saccharimonadales bacterium]